MLAFKGCHFYLLVTEFIKYQVSLKLKKNKTTLVTHPISHAWAGFSAPGSAPFIPCPTLVMGCSWAPTFSGFVSCRWRGEEWTGGSGSPLPSFLRVTTTVCPPGLEVLTLPQSFLCPYCPFKWHRHRRSLSHHPAMQAISLNSSRRERAMYFMPEPPWTQRHM